MQALDFLQVHSDAYETTMDVYTSTSASITEVQASEDGSSISGLTFDVHGDQKTHVEHLDAVMRKQEQKHRFGRILAGRRSLISATCQRIKHPAGHSKAEARAQGVVSLVDSTCEQPRSDDVRTIAFRLSGFTARSDLNFFKKSHVS